MSELAKALVAFQKDAPAIRKDAVNPHFRNKYASLDSIMAAVRPVLLKHGLAISQHPTVLESGMPGLRTVIVHESGVSMEDTMPLAVEKPGPQAQGSALTYARRYAVLAVLGLVADEDDDAQSAEKPPAQVSPRPRASGETAGASEAPAGGTGTTAPAGATDPQRKKIHAMRAQLLDAGLIDEQTAEKLTATATDPELSRAKAGEIISALEKKAT